MPYFYISIKSHIFEMKHGMNILVYSYDCLEYDNFYAREWMNNFYKSLRQL